MNTNIKRHHDEGFTLIELLIVMSVILILSTLAIPSLMNVHKKADETSAQQSVKAIYSAEAQYATAYPSNGYTCSLAALGGAPGSGAPTPQAAQLLDSGLATGNKSGYLFNITNCTKITVNNQDQFTGFEVTAVPSSVGKSGDRGYCIDENNVVKYDPKGGTNCTESLQ